MFICLSSLLSLSPKRHCLGEKENNVALALANVSQQLMSTIYIHDSRTRLPLLCDVSFMKASIKIRDSAFLRAYHTARVYRINRHLNQRLNGLTNERRVVWGLNWPMRGEQSMAAAFCVYFSRASLNLIGGCLVIIRYHLHGYVSTTCK